MRELATAGITGPSFPGASGWPIRLSSSPWSRVFALVVLVAGGVAKL
ncbi:hypothetical protein [Streptomyces bathyalis]|nr:hypothetical protein [Streptomyces bathyalis]